MGLLLFAAEFIDNQEKAGKINAYVSCEIHVKCNKKVIYSNTLRKIKSGEETEYLIKHLRLDASQSNIKKQQNDLDLLPHVIKSLELFLFNKKK